MRYVVVVKPPDDHPGAVRVYGSWRSLESARTFEAKVRAAVEAKADWQDEATGYAYVLALEEPRLREAKSWAVDG